MSDDFRGEAPSADDFLDVLYAIFVRFYACFSAVWKLARDNNTKNTRKYNGGWYTHVVIEQACNR